MLGMPRNRLDKILLIGSGVEGLNSWPLALLNHKEYKHPPRGLTEPEKPMSPMAFRLSSFFPPSPGWNDSM
jgi:hypothetical protein